MRITYLEWISPHCGLVYQFYDCGQAIVYQYIYLLALTEKCPYQKTTTTYIVMTQFCFSFKVTHPKLYKKGAYTLAYALILYAYALAYFDLKIILR